MSNEYEGPDAFIDFSREAADGHFRADMSRDLITLTKTCAEQAFAQQSNAKGEIVVKLRFAADPRGEIDFTYDIKTTPPPKPTARGRFWIGRGGGMTAVHPKQLEIAGTERKRRETPPAEPGRRGEARPEDADDGDDSDGMH